MSQHYLVPILTLKDNGGGAVALEFARQMALRECKVTVLSSAMHGVAAAKRPENAGIEFFIAPAPLRHKLLAVFFFFLYAYVFVVRYRPHVVYTHILTGLIPNLSGHKPWMLAQDLEYRFYNIRIRKVAKHLFVWVTSRSRLFVTSRWLGTFFRRRQLDVAFAGDVGVARRIFGVIDGCSTAERNNDFLLIAKPGAHKRHDETCGIAVKLAQRSYSVTLIDQAPGAYPLPSMPTLRVLDAVSAFQMLQLFRTSKVLLSLSRAEGYGLTPLEALSQGCKVVTTSTPSTQALIHANLRVIVGATDLLVRIEQAAVQAQSAAASASGSLFSGPYMEDWALAAVSASTST